MELPAILLLIGIFILVSVFVARPFVQMLHPKPESVTESSMKAKHEQIISSLRELEFDHSLGKIPEEDYFEQRTELIRVGVLVMKQMDSETIDPTRILAAQSVQEDKVVSDIEIEELITKRRSSRREQASCFCPACGKAVLSSDHFCPSCGSSLQNQLS